MKDPKIILNKLNEWLETEMKIISESEAKSHDHEEKIRLRAELGMLKRILKELEALEQ